MWAAQGGGFKNNEIPAEHARPPVGDDLRPRARQGRQRALLQLRPAVRRALRRARRAAGPARSRSTTRAAPAGRCRTSRFVDPPFRDGGGGNGVSADDHPHGDIRLGQAFMSDVVHAFMESPQYRRGALFIVYDEWGGFFDHVAPPRVPDDRANNADPHEDWAQMGFRIPALTISPYARAGEVSARDARLRVDPQAHLLQVRPRHLNRRHRYALNIGRTMDWGRPRIEPPQLPDPASSRPSPCGRRRLPRRARRRRSRRRRARSQHDLVLLETSGYLERLGFDVPRRRTSSLYRSPTRCAGRAGSRTRRMDGEWIERHAERIAAARPTSCARSSRSPRRRATSPAPRRRSPSCGLLHGGRRGRARPVLDARPRRRPRRPRARRRRAAARCCSATSTRSSRTTTTGR